MGEFKERLKPWVNSQPDHKTSSFQTFLTLTQWKHTDIQHTNPTLAITEIDFIRFTLTR